MESKRDQKVFLARADLWVLSSQRASIKVPNSKKWCPNGTRKSKERAAD